MKESMRKSILLTLMVVFIILSNQTIGEAVEYANPSSANVIVNNQRIDLEAYNINGNNYFKLRDIAKVLSGTKSQFDVKWDSSKNAVNLVSNKRYESIGGELEKSNIITVRVVKNQNPIYKDGNRIDMLAYNIAGNNYFKLRDIGDQFAFRVDYDNASKSILISTGDSGVGPIITNETEVPKRPQISNENKKNPISDFREYKLKIEYDYDRDIEYEYEIKRNGYIEAEIENEIDRTKIRGKEAEEFIRSNLLNLDYTGDRNSIVNQIIRSLNLPSNYRKLELEIEYYDRPDFEIKVWQ